MRILAAEILLRLLMGDPLNQSRLSCVQGNVSPFTLFFWARSYGKNTPFDMMGTLVGAPLPQSRIAEQQPHVLIVSTRP